MEVDPPARIPANTVAARPKKACCRDAQCTGGEAGAGFETFPSIMNAIRISRAAALPLALAAAFPSAFAQASPLKETVVTATRTATRADELVSDVKVIDREAIEASTARTLPELLARTAGLQMSANGGLGKQSSVFIRGAENRHTILLVDGVRLGSATAGTPSWDSIPVEMIERIEILKGPASALYGSDGVGGVVQIFLRKGRDGFHPFASLTLGSEHHVRASAGLEGGQGALGYAVGVQRLRDKGFSTTNRKATFGRFNPDRDPFEQESISATARYEIARDWVADAGLMYADGTSWFDDGLATNDRNAVRAVTAHAGIKGRPMQGWQTELRFGQGNDTANSIEANFPGAFKTEQSQWTWQNNVDTPIGLVLAGLERREQKISATTAYAVTQRTINSVFAGVNGHRGDHSWQFNLRRDSNSQFDDRNTGFVGYGFRLSPAWRVHASHGTSFVMPSFNQLYFPGFGNPALQPERGRNTDVGVSWASNGQEVKLVRYDNKIRGFMTNTTLPINIPRARIEGWTLGYEGKFDALGLYGSLDVLDPRNELNGRRLPRRAKQQMTAGADYTTGAWRFGGSLIHVGDRFDDAANTTPLAGYTTADIYADWQFAKDLTLQAKLNNVTDRRYETAFGFNQAGRSFYLTLRWQPK
jgi:vitamin B12 transporter